MSEDKSKIDSIESIEQEFEDLDKRPADFLDISAELAVPTKQKTSEVDPEIEVDPDVNSGISVEDGITTEFEDPAEVEVDPQMEVDPDPIFESDFFNVENISSLIATAHKLFLPSIAIWSYKNIFFKAGEYEALQPIIKDRDAKMKKGENWIGTADELALMKKYSAYCEFRDHKADLSQDQIDRLQRAWAWQLEKWGFNDASLSVHPMLEAYGSIVLDKGIVIGADKINK